jgi:hypothetical protein
VRSTSDEATERWGAIYLWESSEAAAALRAPVSRARELIGKGPDIAEEFDVEATIEGDFDIAELSRRGLAFGES